MDAKNNNFYVAKLLVILKKILNGGCEVNGNTINAFFRQAYFQGEPD